MSVLYICQDVLHQVIIWNSGFQSKFEVEFQPTLSGATSAAKVYFSLHQANHTFLDAQSVYRDVDGVLSNLTHCLSAECHDMRARKRKA